MKRAVAAAGPLAPAALLTAIAFVLPLAWLLRLSLDRSSGGGMLVDAVTAANYLRFLGDGFYLGVLWRSTWMAALASALTLLLSYPLALFLARTRSRWRGFLAVLTIAPLLVSSVVRTFGWMVILGDQGWVNGLLRLVSLTAAPLRLMNNMLGVLIGLTEVMMPVMTLALIAGFARLDPTLEESARSLGAPPRKVLLRVTLPLSMPGVLLGSLVTFVLSISSFVTPKLLGGGRVAVLATSIYEEALETLNWPFAAAISVVLVAVFGVALMLYERAMRRWMI